MSGELIQLEMIERVRHLCREDERIGAALVYGSFTQGRGDEFSDIEFFVFLKDSEFEGFSPAAWASQIAPTAIHFVSEGGYWIFIFENLIRGEFRFLRLSEIPVLRAFGQVAAELEDTSSMMLFDPDGHLQSFFDALVGARGDQLPKEKIIWLYYSFLNGILTGVNVMARGERARALDRLIDSINKYLLWLVRAREGLLRRGDTRAYRDLEKDLPAPVYRRYVECTGGLEGRDLERGFGAAWAWSRELMDDLDLRYDGLDLPRALVESMDARFKALMREAG